MGEFHKLGRDNFTPEMLHAWAAEAENSFDNGNDMSFEIKSWDSVTGHIEIVTIKSEGYDVNNFYTVSANGIEFGQYEAANEEEALDACARDAGYASEADMVSQLEQPSELVAVIIE